MDSTAADAVLGWQGKEGTRSASDAVLPAGNCRRRAAWLCDLPLHSVDPAPILLDTI